ncbi:MAG TPA: Dna2/Cas4 domain-containing protein, partial [Epsilonproteobacteria bacterium]|nr:Dna2/Cas4 domain-containing protein [Campylobacterota bacterium]
EQTKRKSPQTTSEEALYLPLRNYGLQIQKQQDEDKISSLQSQLFGTAIHYALEMLESFEQSSLENALALTKNRYYFLLGASAILEIHKRIQRLIEDEQFQALCKGASISKELAFSFDGEIKRVDLLLEFEDRVVVVDYKSSKNFADSHREQIAFYQQVVSELTSKKVYGKIVYILEEKIEIISLD